MMIRAILFIILTSSMAFAATTMKQNILSPVTTDAAPFFWTGTFATTYLLITEDQVSDPASKKTHDTKPLGDASKLGDLYGQVYPNAIYVVGMLGDSFFSRRRDSYMKAGHMFKATFYAGLMATIIKYTVREPRPDNSKEKNSFPSGHTTTAFAFATTVATEHEWYWGALAIGMASLTGYSRMNDGRHFLHDVVAGMTLGASYGLGTYYTRWGQGRLYAFVPIIDGDKNGIKVVTSF